MQIGGKGKLSPSTIRVTGFLAKSRETVKFTSSFLHAGFQRFEFFSSAQAYQVPMAIQQLAPVGALEESRCLGLGEQPDGPLGIFVRLVLVRFLAADVAEEAGGNEDSVRGRRGLSQHRFCFFRS